jgi:hypothetical protein
MLRIGKLTGNVYDENTELSSIRECCVMVRKENLDEELKRWKMARINSDCDKCRGCPEYQRES